MGLILKKVFILIFTSPFCGHGHDVNTSIHLINWIGKNHLASNYLQRMTCTEWIVILLLSQFFVYNTLLKTSAWVCSPSGTEPRSNTKCPLDHIGSLSQSTGTLIYCKLISDIT